ncbi:hypothetical protein KIN20_018410 [Parelaphostrongylus tenuis]|uniref:Uncharacterized protein n=1 Tax=Parelaphostrongylus tenuis TaxID=148309 RepID=A0AAD5QUB2_PARTN|nr:hypothetical protein KIN20_018410 [Parelaphostrongylus tenuis]
METISATWSAGSLVPSDAAHLKAGCEFDSPLQRTPTTHLLHHHSVILTFITKTKSLAAETTHEMFRDLCGGSMHGKESIANAGIRKMCRQSSRKSHAKSDNTKFLVAQNFESMQLAYDTTN